MRFQVRTTVLMRSGLFWGVTTPSGKEVYTFRKDVIIHLDGYAVQELDPIFGDHALRNVGICLSESRPYYCGRSILCDLRVTGAFLVCFHSSVVWRCAVEEHPAACNLCRSCSVDCTSLISCFV